MGRKIRFRASESTDEPRSSEWLGYGEIEPKVHNCRLSRVVEVAFEDAEIVELSITYKDGSVMEFADRESLQAKKG